MNKSPNILLFLFTSGFSVVLLLLDGLEDYSNDGGVDGHLFFEFFIIFALCIQIIFLLKWLLKLNGQKKQLSNDATYWHEEHQKVLKGVGETINKQFDFWALTPTEKEIGLLLLKGLSFSEISKVRNTTERTVRQQATNVYKKAKLKGRHEFAAFFLEDLLLPS